MIQSHFEKRFLLLACGLAALQGAASAQGLVSTSGTVIAANGDTIHDNAGAPMSGFTFNNLGDNCVLDAGGHVFFRGRFVDAGATTTPFNDTAYFYGTSRADLKLVVRGGAQAPGMAPGILLRTGGGISSSLTANVRVTKNGTLMWASNVDDGGATVDSSNSEAMFGGPFATQNLLVRKGDAAPGTTGAVFVQAFASPQYSTTGIDDNGHVYFMGALTGGDVTTASGMNNQAGIWAGLPGALDMVVRKGSPVSGLSGAVATDTFTTLSSTLLSNGSSHLLYDVALSTTQGAPAATIANDRALMVYTPGSGSTVLAREGDPAPGTIGATFNAINADGWVPGIAANAWTRNDEAIFVTELRGGDVFSATNDRAIYRGGVGTLALVVRKGDAAPGTDGTFDAFGSTSALLNANGRVAIQAQIAGGTSSIADDTGIWTGTPASLALIVREGQTMPGTGGSIASAFNNTAMYFNDLGQVIFNVNLSGGVITGLSLWAWDPALGLFPMVLNGDQVQVTPGVFKTVNGFGSAPAGNSDGASLHFGHNGRLALRLNFTDTTNAIATVSIPVSTPATPFCFGDGTGTACPCGNSGALGNGCASSINAGGANLSASGSASIGADTFELDGTGMPNSSALYFQGTARVNGGFGTAFGDGLRCAGGMIVRLGTKTNVGGASHYPSSGDQPVATRGLITSPGTFSYQIWYRNAAAFCTASTFNLSNGTQVAWAP